MKKKSYIILFLYYFIGSLINNMYMIPLIFKESLPLTLLQHVLFALFLAGDLLILYVLIFNLKRNKRTNEEKKMSEKKDEELLKKWKKAIQEGGIVSKRFIPITTIHEDFNEFQGERGTNMPISEKEMIDTWKKLLKGTQEKRLPINSNRRRLG